MQQSISGPGSIPIKNNIKKKFPESFFFFFQWETLQRIPAMKKLSKSRSAVRRWLAPFVE